MVCLRRFKKEKKIESEHHIEAINPSLWPLGTIRCLHASVKFLNKLVPIFNIDERINLRVATEKY